MRPGIYSALCIRPECLTEFIADSQMLVEQATEWFLSPLSETPWHSYQTFLTWVRSTRSHPSYSFLSSQSSCSLLLTSSWVYVSRTAVLRMQGKPALFPERASGFWGQTKDSCSWWGSLPSCSSFPTAAQRAQCAAPVRLLKHSHARLTNRKLGSWWEDVCFEYLNFCLPKYFFLFFFFF